MHVTFYTFGTPEVHVFDNVKRIEVSGRWRGVNAAAGYIYGVCLVNKSGERSEEIFLGSSEDEEPIRQFVKSVSAFADLRVEHTGYRMSNC